MRSRASSATSLPFASRTATEPRYLAEKVPSEAARAGGRKHDRGRGDGEHWDMEGDEGRLRGVEYAARCVLTHRHKYELSTHKRCSVDVQASSLLWPRSVLPGMTATIRTRVHTCISEHTRVRSTAKKKKSSSAAR